MPEGESQYGVVVLFGDNEEPSLMILALDWFVIVSASTTEIRKNDFTSTTRRTAARKPMGRESER